MDAFVKTRRNRSNADTGASKNNGNSSHQYLHQDDGDEHYQKKQLAMIAFSSICNHAASSSSSSRNRMTTDALFALTGAAGAAAAAAWGVSSATSGSVQSARKRRLDQNGSETSSCYEADDTSSGSSFSMEQNRRSYCSSPLSESSYDFSCSDEYSGVGAAEGSPYQLLAAPTRTSTGPSPLFLLDSDVVATVLTYLDPSEILNVLTMPLCREWRQNYGTEQDIWKTLCLLEPFKAKVGLGDQQQGNDSSTDSDDSSFSSLPIGPTAKELFGEYRLMFTSFVRCVRYLARIQEDSRNGGNNEFATASSSPSFSIAVGESESQPRSGGGGFPHFGMSRNLKKFLQRRKGAFDHITEASSPVSRPPTTPAAASATPAHLNTFPVGVTDDGYRNKRRAAPNTTSNSSDGHMHKKPKYGKSMITARLLAPSSKGEPSHLQMPRSCAIFSIVNWMVAYPDVEGIQIQCVATLPVLLEDEAQRLTAQRAGLVEVILQAMLRYPDCAKLHVAAFHAMVLLARPLGGREGMLFDNSNAETSPSHNLGLIARATSSSSPSSTSPQPRKLNGINGVAVMLESMRRFEGDADIQAMACWALVNLALVPAQKTMILSLGGIEATANAMRRHPMSYDVQFRALFALINLVVASKTPTPLNVIDNDVHQERRGALGHKTEKDVLDATVHEVSGLVVGAMKNFCSSSTILNRACLVLHNLAQSPAYLTTLLWTPQCYQMLEWSIANYPTDPVLRRSATSTLHRLQVLLSGDPSLRRRFLESIRAQGEENHQAVLRQRQRHNRNAAAPAPGPVVPNV